MSQDDVPTAASAAFDGEAAARGALTRIEEVRLEIAVLAKHMPQKGRALALAHTKLDEARLWLQDAIGYERTDAQ